MEPAEVLAKSFRVVLGTLWGGVLVLCGLWLVGGPRRLIPADLASLGGGGGGGGSGGASAWWAGIACIAAGQFVFLAVAADRLCPMNNRRLADVLQTAWTGVFALGVLGALLTVFASRG